MGRMRPFASWLKVLSKITRVGKGVGKGSLRHGLGGGIKCCSYHGKQFGGPSKS